MSQGLERFECRFDFRRMMPIVIDHAKTRIPEQFLLTPRHPLKRDDSGCNLRGGKIELVQQGYHRASVGEIFLAQELSREQAEALAGVPYLEIG